MSGTLADSSPEKTALSVFSAFAILRNGLRGFYLDAMKDADSEENYMR
jgi:hypothetical protein